jgi:putative ABC transport system permease protein
MTQLRQTLRRLLRAPGFTVASVLTLAIGIGATVAIFSVVNGVLIKPLPFPESDRLVALTHRSAQLADGDLPASPAIYFTYRDNNRTFRSVALWQGGTASVTGSSEPEEVRTIVTTFEFLPTLRVVPAVGRAFAEADDQPNSEPTVILSFDYWLRRFGGAENAIGQRLVVDGVAHTIIGVLPKDFRFLRRSASLMLPKRPVRALSYVGPLGENAIARLRDGVTLAEANADVERMIPILMNTFPPVPGMDMKVFRNLRLHANVKRLKETFVGDLDDVLWILMGTIGILLAVACVNVANLHLVRTEGRGQELAIESALGASRGRIARNLLLESVLISFVGGALGLVLAAAALPVLLTTAADELPSVLRVTIDPTVLAFALSASLASGLLFGGVSALRYAAPRVAGMPAAAQRSYTPGRDQHRLRSAFIVVQVALALILLVASGLMIRTFQSLRSVDPGFVGPEQVQTFRVSIPQGAVADFTRVVRMFEGMEDRLSDVTGVESVGFASHVPLGNPGPSAGFFVDPSNLPGGVAPPQSEFRYVSPGFFETLGTPLVAGRTFEWADHLEPRRVAIVSESFARREWGSAAAALGKRLRMTLAEPWRQIVGVAGDVHQENLDRAAPDSVYLTLGDPLAQYSSRAVTFAVRSGRVGTPGFIADLKRAVWSVDPSLPLASVQTLGNLYDQATARTALTLTLLAITGGMALGLGLVGIYGVISYMLVQRTREIGVRIALGAQSAALNRMLLGQVLALVLVGVALGLGGAAGLSRLMQSLLFGVSALDPATYILVAAVLIATAAVAGYLPARRAMRIDPMQALREE